VPETLSPEDASKIDHRDSQAGDSVFPHQLGDLATEAQDRGVVGGGSAESHRSDARLGAGRDGAQ
jgi:hypothetical protein